MRLSSRCQKITPSQTLALDAQAKKLQAEGKNIINLTAGELDFAVPKKLQQGAIAAAKQGNNLYTKAAGLDSLRQAVAKTLSRKLRVKYAAEEIIITNGAKQGLYSLFQVILNPGDEVIVPLPAWVSYFEHIKLAGGKAIRVPTTDKFELDLKAIKKALNKKTKAILLNSPNNPTGKIYANKNLLALSKLIAKKNIWLISDEVYASITFDKKFISPVTLSPGLKKQFVYLGSASKEMAITGWRLGWLAGPEELIKGLARLQGHLCGNVCNLAQLAAVEALTQGLKESKKILAELKRRRRLVYRAINSLPGLSCQNPDGAFYFFINTSQVDHDSIRFCARLLNEAGVALVPGDFFGAPGYVRLSFANNYTNLLKAVNRIKKFIGHY